MKKIEYVDEELFTTKEIEFSDEHYNLAEEIHSHYKSELYSKCTPIMVSSDQKSLVFAVNLGDKEKDIVAYERGDDLYKIKIEKAR
jgi:hypothetical protein